MFARAIVCFPDRKRNAFDGSLSRIFLHRAFPLSSMANCVRRMAENVLCGKRRSNILRRLNFFGFFGSGLTPDPFLSRAMAVRGPAYTYCSPQEDFAAPDRCRVMRAAQIGQFKTTTFVPTLTLP